MTFLTNENATGLESIIFVLYNIIIIASVQHNYTYAIIIIYFYHGYVCVGSIINTNIRSISIYTYSITSLAVSRPLPQSYILILCFPQNLENRFETNCLYLFLSFYLHPRLFIRPPINTVLTLLLEISFTYCLKIASRGDTLTHVFQTRTPSFYIVL